MDWTVFWKKMGGLAAFVVILATIALMFGTLAHPGP